MNLKKTQNILSCSCGKEIPGCKTKLHNPDEEGNGEICFWGRHIFMGYLSMPDKTEEAIDADGWLHSGDLGKHDENGFLFITGRIKGTCSVFLVKLDNSQTATFTLDQGKRLRFSLKVSKDNGSSVVWPLHTKSVFFIPN